MATAFLAPTSVDEPERSYKGAYECRAKKFDQRNVLIFLIIGGKKGVRNISKIALRMEVVNVAWSTRPVSVTLFLLDQPLRLGHTKIVPPQTCSLGLLLGQFFDTRWRKEQLFMAQFVVNILRVVLVKVMCWGSFQSLVDELI